MPVTVVVVVNALLGIPHGAIDHLVGAAREFARLAAPRCAVSVAALAVFITSAPAVGHPDVIVPVTLVFVSMLTLPHMIGVERLWRAEREVEGRR